MTALYTAVATATGAPNRKVTSDNGVLSLELRSPKALGGANDDYTNPEQLFAAGYAGKLDTGGFIFAVTLQVNVPGVSLEQAKELADKAHQVCPYSNSTRGNIEVTTEVTNN